MRFDREVTKQLMERVTLFEQRPPQVVVQPLPLTRETNPRPNPDPIAVGLPGLSPETLGWQQKFQSLGLPTSQKNTDSQTIVYVNSSKPSDPSPESPVVDPVAPLTQTVPTDQNQKKVRQTFTP